MTETEGFNLTKIDGEYTIQTGYKYNGCSDEKKKALQAAVTNAVILACSGIKTIYPGDAPIPLRFIDFKHQAALDYFGPYSQNKGEQDKIFKTLEVACFAFPGWGLSDWWNSRYVELNCETKLAKGCASGKTLAVTSNRIKDFGYPLITFCDLYFDKLPSLDTALVKVDANANHEQENILNIRSQGQS